MAWTGIENFDSYSAGASISAGAGGSGWSANWALNSGAATTENAPAGGMSGKSLKMASGVAGNVSRTVNGATTGECYFEIQASSVASASNTHSITLFNGGAGVIIGRLGITTAGAFEFYNATTATYESVGTMTANTKHTIKIKYGHVADKYAVSFDGGAYGADKGTNGTLGSPNKITIDHTTSDARDFWVDNIADTAPVEAPALLTSLISYWKFDESSGNALDSDGYNTLTNNATATYSAGKINNGVALARASNQFMSIADASQTGLDLSTDFSFSAWVKVTTAPTSGQQFAIYGKDDNGTTGRSYWFWYANSGGTLRFEYGLFPTGYSYPGYVSYTLNQDLGTATWKHIVVVCTLANANATKFTLYVDGTSVGNGTLADGTGATSIQNGAADFKIGQGHTSGIQWDGMIDEVGIWSRTLSSTEVTSLYNGGAGLAYPLTVAASTFIPRIIMN